MFGALQVSAGVGRSSSDSSRRQIDLNTSNAKGPVRSVVGDVLSDIGGLRPRLDYFRFSADWYGRRARPPTRRPWKLS